MQPQARAIVCTKQTSPNGRPTEILAQLVETWTAGQFSIETERLGDRNTADDGSLLTQEAAHRCDPSDLNRPLQSSDRRTQRPVMSAERPFFGPPVVSPSCGRLPGPPGRTSPSQTAAPQDIHSHDEKTKVQDLALNR